MGRDRLGRMARTLGSLADTQQLARTLLEHLPPGALLVLAGPLGAGKTTLVQALARALGSGAQVSSPTYTLVHEYPTPAGVLVHIDAYRLGGADTGTHTGTDAGTDTGVDALFELGLDDYLERARLTAVEWGEGLLSTFPDALVVRLSFHDDVRRAAVTQGEKELV